ncbi:hypothetical protein AJ80_06972 [Polytolypa hystricis UAMH7299]|uniref:Sialidase domain-containing protein n=1 Tax=Polytolypa hystricis (strain UAMH7299) TaxID=1447883 RepID=A0A2B7XJA5_POLH7|nr:hypothetical protein AJ80_06972 [Polytolypa hystricis UAMH7299]
MKLSTLLLSLLPLLPAAAALPGKGNGHDRPSRPRPRPGPEAFTGVTIFTPPSNYTDPRVLYARTAQLPSGSILATWENYSPEPPPVYFPIYQSDDFGKTWVEISRVHDEGYGWGLRYQPFLYVLPQRIGEFPAGTVLLSGSSIPTDLSRTQIDIYASLDNGKTWGFLSHIAAGGVAIPNNGLTPVWEPFLMVWQNQLICYYADQRDNATHGQKLSHQISSDLRSWSAPVTDTAYPTYTDRPGMPTVALLPNGEYIYVYEYGGGPGISGGYKFPVYFRKSRDPTRFDAAAHTLVRTDGGVVPEGSPYVVWTPFGGPRGTVIISCGTRSEIFVNNNLGEGEWRLIGTPEGVSYTRHLRVLEEDKSKLLIMGGGYLPPSTTNRVTVSVIDLNEVL